MANVWMIFSLIRSVGRKKLKTIQDILCHMHIHPAVPLLLLLLLLHQCCICWTGFRLLLVHHQESVSVKEAWKSVLKREAARSRIRASRGPCSDDEWIMRVYQDDIYTFTLEKIVWDHFKFTRLCSYRPFFALLSFAECLSEVTGAGRARKRQYLTLIPMN